MTPKYPEIKLKLTGCDGNAFAVMARGRTALRKAKLSEDVVKEFTTEATSGDYDHLLQTCMKSMDVS